MNDYRQKQENRHAAWELFKYYRAHPELLRISRHRKQYKTAKKLLIAFYSTSALVRHTTRRAVEEALCMLAQAENQEHSS